MRLVAIGKVHGYAQRQDGELAGVEAHCVGTAKVDPVAIDSDGELFKVGVMIADKDGQRFRHRDSPFCFSFSPQRVSF